MSREKFILDKLSTISSNLLILHKKEKLERFKGERKEINSWF